jgi:aspartyl/asparaginyl beta-hydroxylase (cupin superfamily)
LKTVNQNCDNGAARQIEPAHQSLGQGNTKFKLREAVADNLIVRRALRRVEESHEQENHMAHTSHKSYSRHSTHSSGWLDPKSEAETLTRRAFFSQEEYPELAFIRNEWRTIRDEGRNLRDSMIWIEDRRTAGQVWAFAPLLMEEGQRTPDRDRLCEFLRARAPRTMTILRDIPTLLGCGFSLLLAQGRIGTHDHTRPFVTAILGLSSADPSWIKVGSETQFIRKGELVIFDYTLPHEVVNESSVDRLALLILLPNKSLAGQTKG